MVNQMEKMEKWKIKWKLGNILGNSFGGPCFLLVIMVPCRQQPSLSSPTSLSTLKQQDRTGYRAGGVEGSLVSSPRVTCD